MRTSLAIALLLLAPLARAAEDRFSPYAADAEHLWNRVHRALFVRTDKDGKQYVHSLDPFLPQRGVGPATFLLEGDSHRRAVALLDEFIAAPSDAMIADPLKRLFLQRDLWDLFDYVAWYPDEWVYRSRYEPAAIELRTRLAKAIARLTLSDSEIKALPDNNQSAVKSKLFPAEQDPQHHEQPFLPADLLDPAGSWVRYLDTSETEPMAGSHFHQSSGRAVHVIFLRLPNGRAATADYLKGIYRDSITQFPQGTMLAMMRRAIVIDQANKLRVTPVTESVQIRVYRRIPQDPKANSHDDLGEQDVCEFTIDRAKLFAGESGLRAVGPKDPTEPGADNGGEVFVPVRRPMIGALESCTACHQGPGVYSVLSMQRGLRADPKLHGQEIFRTFDWDVEMKSTVFAKTRQYNWGLLQGLLEANQTR